MPHSPNLFPLKLLVISLGVLLVGAFVFVLTTIATRANNVMAQADCPDASVHLNGKGTLVSLKPDGGTVQLIVRSALDDKVLTVDRCSGKLLQTFTVTP